MPGGRSIDAVAGNIIHVSRKGCVRPNKEGKQYVNHS